MTKLLIVLGSGGVGKTTSSAALAWALAEQGLRTVVITVDPARRLAQVLGLKSLSNEAQEVEVFPGSGGRLSALWLETGGALENLVRRHAGHLPRIEKILQHRLFKVIQNQLGGIEEYLGVEKVLELARSGRFDACILDTPPSQHALDFLESPRHLLRFFDESVLRVFLQPEEQSHQPGFFSRLFKGGRDQMIDLFKNFLGQGFLGELSELLGAMKPLHEVLRQTAQEIESRVRDDQTRFLLVSTLEAYPLDEGRLLSQELRARGLGPEKLLVLNKCLPSSPPDSESELETRLGPEGAAHLQAVYKQQQILRDQVSREHSGAAVAEIARHSVRQLSRAELLGVGSEIVQAWPSSDRKYFLKS